MNDPQRERALGPYLEKLRGWNEAGGEPADLDRSARIRVGKHAVTVRPWERARIREAFRPGDGAAPWTRLLAQGIALLTKTLVDVGQLQRDPHMPLEAMYRVQAELMLDTAIGMALLRETQDAIDGLVFSGSVEQAKQLSEFRNKVARTINGIKRLLSETERKQAENIAGEPARAETEAGGEAGRGDPLKRLAGAIEEAQEQPTGWSAIRKPRRRPTTVVMPVRVPTRTEVLGTMLLLALAAWTVFVKVPSVMIEKPKQLSPWATSRPDLFERFDARHPSLFVTLAPDAWESLSSSGKADLLDNLSGLAKEFHYRGLLIRTAEGRPVAHWLSVSGAAVIEAGEEPPPPPEIAADSLHAEPEPL
jgi:hypothetical protein